MRKRLLVIAVVVAVGLAAGLAAVTNRYVFRVAGTGCAYRFDRWTGRVSH